jgi:hypothetical protein
MTSNQKVLPSSIKNLLAGARKLLRVYVGLQTLFIVICIVLLLFWVGGVVDYLPVTFGGSETPVWLRQMLAVLIAGGTIWTVCGWALPRLFTRIPDRSIALLIEKHHPQLNNELITAVELFEREDSPNSSHGFDGSNPEVHEKMLVQVREAVKSKSDTIDLYRLFDWTPVWTAGMCVLVSLGVTGMAAFAMPEWTSRWSQRLFLLSDEPWPRMAELRADGIQIQLPPFTGQLAAERQLLEFSDGRVTVHSGSNSVLQVSAKSEGKTVPEVCTVFYSDREGNRGRANMRRIGSVTDGWQQFLLDGPPLDGLNTDLGLRVLGLDARLTDLRIQAADPTLITDVKLQLTYPEYLLASLTRSSTETIAYRNGLRIPQGTEVTVIGTASTELRHVDFVNRQSEDADDQIQVQSKDVTGQQFAIGLGTLDTTQTLELRPLSSLGLPPDRVSTYLLTVQQDEVPTVSSQLAGIGNAITPNAILPVRGEVIDDHGIASIEVSFASSSGQEGNATSSECSVPVPIPDTPDLSMDIDLVQLAEKGKLSLSPGSTLGFALKATDFYNLGDSPHVGVGQTKQLAVVTADELLVLLDRQELELRQRLDIIISELEQLNALFDSFSVGENGESATWNQGNQFQGAEQDRSSFVSITMPQDEEELARRRRMRILRAQQSVLQADKSEQELAGIAANVENLRLQLQNNRIDSYDRQARLKDKVHTPLVGLLSGRYPRFQASLAELQSAALSDGGLAESKQAQTLLREVLDELATIQKNMFDMEDFNEIINLVRDLIEDQDALIESTEKEQRARILDILK